MPTRTITEEEENAYREEFAALLLKTRTDRGETQEEVARSIGVAWSVYRSWEKGRATPRGYVFLKLCQHFGWPFPLGDNRRYLQMAPDLLERRRTPRRRRHYPVPLVA